MIISFVSIKGGVGKTTLAVETASSLANDYGKKVLLIDGNFSAPNISLNLGLQTNSTLHDLLSGKLKNIGNITYETHGFDFIPAALDFKDPVYFLKLRDALDKIRDNYDFIIIDSSPNVQEVLPVIASSDKIFVVTTPDVSTLVTSMKAARLAQIRKVPIEGIIINKIRHPRFELTLNEIEKTSNIPVVARIQDDKEMLESLFYFKPHNMHKPNSAVSQEIRRFAGSLAGKPERIGWFMKNFSKVGNFGKEKVNREILRQKLYQEQFC